ncbi:unnamed protein product [Heligmosomoides polygyrus]|uniref:Ubiquitin-like domain-containing protein n=1 Tax=Heligmosomoides polygyrus TaxID=6339 RepID=A0A183FYK5_HELPZ|nr:unnamed protein product [Heligmosomoides polygyrus]
MIRRCLDDDDDLVAAGLKDGAKLTVILNSGENAYLNAEMCAKLKAILGSSASPITMLRLWQIDFVLVKYRDRSLVTDAKVVPYDTVAPQYRPLICTLKIVPPRMEQGERCGAPRIKWWRMREKEAALISGVRLPTVTTVGETWKKATDAIRQAARRVWYQPPISAEGWKAWLAWTGSRVKNRSFEKGDPAETVANETL